MLKMPITSTVLFHFSKTYKHNLFYLHPGLAANKTQYLELRVVVFMDSIHTGYEDHCLRHHLYLHIWRAEGVVMMVSHNTNCIGTIVSHHMSQCPASLQHTAKAGTVNFPIFQMRNKGMVGLRLPFGHTDGRSTA